MSFEDWQQLTTTERIVRWIERLARGKRWAGVGFIIVAFVLLLIGAVLILVDIRPLTVAVAPESADRLRELDRVHESLGRLQMFIDDQSRKIREEQKTLNELSRERSQLEPVVRSDRAAIEQLLASQDARSQRERRKDIVVSFIFGVGSSLLASILFEMLRPGRVRRLGGGGGS